MVVAWGRQPFVASVGGRGRAGSGLDKAIEKSPIRFGQAAPLLIHRRHPFMSPSARVKESPGPAIGQPGVLVHF